VFNQLASFTGTARITLDLDGSSPGQLRDRLQDLLGQLGQQHQHKDSRQMLLCLAKLMQREKVLLLLDNVNHTAQLDGLLPNTVGVSSGSRVIVTSREPDLRNSQAYAVSPAVFRVAVKADVTVWLACNVAWCASVQQPNSQGKRSASSVISATVPNGVA